MFAIYSDATMILKVNCMKLVYFCDETRIMYDVNVHLSHLLYHIIILYVSIWGHWFLEYHNICAHEEGVIAEVHITLDGVMTMFVTQQVFLFFNLFHRKTKVT